MSYYLDCMGKFQIWIS